jgi:hypothetical protein
MTKKMLTILAAVVLIALPLATQGTGLGNGNGSGTGHGNGNNNGNGCGNGAGDGSGPIHNILAGTPFTFSGTVIGIGSQGDGMEIATVDGNVSVQGLGPQRYWDELGIDKPDLGENVAVYGYTVDFNGKPMNILSKVEFNGVTVELRDSETGTPLWRQKGNGYGVGNGGNGHYGNGEGFRFDILNGTPFSFGGDVIDIGFTSCGARGSGMTIATDTANITVDGLGPLGYWDSLDATRPTVGDYVEVTGYAVAYNGNTLNILMTVTTNGQTVQLRDPETGYPLWRKGSN